MPQFHDLLKIKMDNFVHLVYLITNNFPKREIYSSASQLRRASLSVILNYIEGYSRRRNKVYKNYLEISYASLKEADYLLDFSFTEKLISSDHYKKAKTISDEIGAMLWSVLSNK